MSNASDQKQNYGFLTLLPPVKLFIFFLQPHTHVKDAFLAINNIATRVFNHLACYKLFGLKLPSRLFINIDLINIGNAA